MHIQCPHCHGPIEVVGKSHEVVCPSCGSSIEIEAGKTVTWTPSGQERRVGKFELLAELGMGAFGTVFKARDTELDRLVAIKIPRGGNLLSDGDGARFLREARSAAQLEHPGIVSVFETGSANGAYYIASRLVEGETLADRLTRTKLGFRQAAELLKQVAEAVHYAHERGVIHRDLKPSNVMLDMDDRPHVMDFGLAKRDAGEITVTLDGHVLGTPAYMSPEQAKGEAHTVDARSDVYSLGVMLYELLTGELPFRGNRRMLLVQVLKDEPRPPRRLNNHVPRDLETICLKSLAKEPARRYRTAADLAAELGRWLTGEPIHARPIGPLARSWRWCRRKPMTAALVGVAALLLVTLGIGGPIVAVREAELRLTATRRETEVKQALVRERKALLRAQRQGRVANARRLAAESAAVLQEFPVRSALLAMAAINAAAADDDATLAGAESTLRESLAVLGGFPLPGFVAGDFKVFSINERWLALGGEEDGSAQVWDLEAADLATKPAVLRGHEKRIRCLAISPDAQWLATGSEDSTARVWDLAAPDPAVAPRILRGHTSVINCLAISPNGRWLVTGSGDRTARVWDLAASDPAVAPRILRGHTEAIRCLAISPDGRWLVTGSGDGTARVWDLAASDPAVAPRILRRFDGQGVTDLTIGPDGRSLIARYLVGMVVWDLAAPDPAAMLRTNISTIDDEEIWCHAISPDGRWLATGGAQGTVKVWDLTASDPAVAPRFLRSHSDAVNCVTFSPDGRWLVTGGGDGTARVWELAAADPTAPNRILRGHDEPITFVAISSDGRWMVTGSWFKGTIWNLAAADASSAPTILRGHEESISCLTISPDGRWLVTGSNDSTARVWDLAAPDPAVAPRILSGHKFAIRCLAITPNGRSLITGSGDGTARVWDLIANDPVAAPRILGGHEQGVSCLAISPDGRWLVTRSVDGTARVWDLIANDPTAAPRILGGHELGVFCLAISPDGRWLVTGSTDGTARVWDLAGPDPAVAPRILRGHTEFISCLAISPNGRWLVTGSTDKTARMWDLTAADPAAAPRILRGHEDQIFNLAISPDGRWLVTAGVDHWAGLWNLAAIDPAATLMILRGHNLQIHELAISHDSRWLVTGSRDKTARAWDLTASDPAAASRLMRGHEDLVGSLALSPDGRWLVTGSADKTARVWDFQLKDLVKRAKAVVGRDLTVEERQQYLAKPVKGIEGATRRGWSAFLQKGFESQASRIVRGFFDKALLKEEARAAIIADSKIPEPLRSRALELASSHWDELVAQEAKRLVDELYAMTLLKENVRAAIVADGSLREDVRVWSLKLADGLQEDSNTLNNASWRVVREPSRLADEYALALRQAEAADRLSPNDGNVLNTLGAARYRAGSYDLALASLTRSHELNAKKLRGQSNPYDIVFLAMTHHHLGHADEARTLLARLRDLLRQDAWKSDSEIRLLFGEAEQLIEPTPAAVSVP